MVSGLFIGDDYCSVFFVYGVNWVFDDCYWGVFKFLIGLKFGFIFG